MSGHEIVWTFDGDTVTSKVICNEHEGADCRLAGTGDCYCESYSIERDPDGTPFHLAGDFSESNKPRHEMKPVDYCNVALFLNESDFEELCEPHVTFPIGRTEIEPVWQGDYYSWKPAEVTP